MFNISFTLEAQGGVFSRERWRGQYLFFCLLFFVFLYKRCYFVQQNLYVSGIMSENMGMCKIAHFAMFLCGSYILDVNACECAKKENVLAFMMVKRFFKLDD